MQIDSLSGSLEQNSVKRMADGTKLGLRGCGGGGSQIALTNLFAALQSQAHLRH
jgi:hypothetical protein